MTPLSKHLILTIVLRIEPIRKLCPTMIFVLFKVVFLSWWMWSVFINKRLCLSFGNLWSKLSRFKDLWPDRVLWFITRLLFCLENPISWKGFYCVNLSHWLFVSLRIFCSPVIFVSLASFLFPLVSIVAFMMRAWTLWLRTLALCQIVSSDFFKHMAANALSRFSPTWLSKSASSWCTTLGV